MNTEERKKLIAQQYAEKHGIVGYKVKGNRMIYYKNHIEQTEPYTIKVTVRLNTLEEEEQKLNYYNKKGDFNMKKECVKSGKEKRQLCN